MVIAITKTILVGFEVITTIATIAITTTTTTLVSPVATE